MSSVFAVLVETSTTTYVERKNNLHLPPYCADLARESIVLTGDTRLPFFVLSLFSIDGLQMYNCMQPGFQGGRKFIGKSQVKIIIT